MTLNSFNYSNLNILIIGEAMLDEYTHGDTTRISPEAPVQVIKYQKTSINLGGSANIAQNISNLGAKVDILTFVGDDTGKEKIN